jgi:hypothetical protein
MAADNAGKFNSSNSVKTDQIEEQISLRNQNELSTPNDPSSSSEGSGTEMTFLGSEVWVFGGQELSLVSTGPIPRRTGFELVSGVVQVGFKA